MYSNDKTVRPAYVLILALLIGSFSERAGADFSVAISPEHQGTSIEGAQEHVPCAMAGGSSAVLGTSLYVAPHPTLGADCRGLWVLDLPGETGEEVAPAQSPDRWRQVPAAGVGLDPSLWDSPAILASQDNGHRQVLWVIGAANGETTETRSSQVWQYDPASPSEAWSRRKDLSIGEVGLHAGPGSATAVGPSHLLVFTQVPSRGPTALAYNTITDAWAEYPIVADSLPDGDDRRLEGIDFSRSSVMSAPDAMLITTRSEIDGVLKEQVWSARILGTEVTFGWQNMTVLIVYLLAMVLVGVYFLNKNKSVDDYFRGGQSIPWWAAACSMYATMLSSLTYVAMPALVYRTDWVVWIGIWTILLVTPIAAHVAMPFFRQIDATSAYEYLSKRFSMPVRMFASGLFTLFHIGRMGIVMALTALALAAVTPFDAWHCVLIMGVLCLIYCTMGGIEAVIWTDTIQTIVLLLGAILCFFIILGGIDGGFTGFVEAGMRDEKFRMVNLDFSLDSATTLAIWVIVLGGLGQNLSSYTADQAVVQRYVTTENERAAAKSIWMNGVLAPAASILFFVIGTGLYVFYQANAGQLDPTKQLDQVFPVFISTQLPVGVAGLIIAGVFAAAQSTVSTSMNSIATTIVTDFMRPFNVCVSERAYLSAARWFTFLVGTLGTFAGLVFISPEIRSLMEEYFKVIGMFMGALGGLFILGVVSTRANARGAVVGLLAGVGAMLYTWLQDLANGYLYATIGIIVCLVTGYIASLLFKSDSANAVEGLTLHTMRRVPEST